MDVSRSTLGTQPQLLAIGLIALGVLVHLAGFFAFRVVAEPQSVPQPVRHFITFPTGVEQTDPIVAELSALSDSEPLFLPTRWNATVPLVEPEQAEVLRSPFKPFPAVVTMGEGGGGLFFQARPATPDGPKDVLSRDTMNVFTSFGQGPADARPVPRNGLEVEIRDFYTDELVKVQTLPYSDASLDGLQNRGFAEYHVQLQRGSLVGPPVLASGTADEALDRTLSELLLNSDAMEDLSAGYYRVLIGQ